MRRLFLSFGGAGFLRPAPGTWGSLAALPAAWLLYTLGGPILIVVATGLFYALGIAATHAETQDTEDHDPSSFADLNDGSNTVLEVLFAYAARPHVDEQVSQ